MQPPHFINRAIYAVSLNIVAARIYLSQANLSSPFTAAGAKLKVAKSLKEPYADRLCWSGESEEKVQRG